MKDLDDMSDHERDEFLRSAFRPGGMVFDPIVKPPETPEQTLARVEAHADLVMDQCPHCHAVKHVDEVRDGVAVAMGITHEEGCPLA